MEGNRVQIDGIWYSVCSHCGEPLAAGYDSPKPDGSEQAALKGQAVRRRVLCGPAYKEEYAEVYPEAPVPEVPDGLLISRS